MSPGCAWADRVHATTEQEEWGGSEGVLCTGAGSQAGVELTSRDHRGCKRVGVDLTDVGGGEDIDELLGQYAH